MKIINIVVLNILIINISFHCSLIILAYTCTNICFPVIARRFYTKMLGVPHFHQIKNERFTSSLIPPTGYLIEGIKWVDFNISSQEFRPALTLSMGQCFSWNRLDNENCWVGVLGKFPVAILQTENSSYYGCLTSKENINLSIDDEILLHKIIYDYFQLVYKMETYMQVWVNKCDRMSAVASALHGIRVLQQDPWECLISFICSSNNNIKRISQMLTKLRMTYGQYICSVVKIPQNNINRISKWHVIIKSNGSKDTEIKTEVTDDSTFQSPPLRKSKSYTSTEIKLEELENIKDITPTASYSLYTFPTPESLATATESELRLLGVGYRASYLRESASLIQQFGGIDWLLSLRNLERLEVQQHLLKLHGVGRKVADCVALFSLNQYSTIPVDTHVWDIAVRDYHPPLANYKSLTPAVYEEVGNIFRNLFGDHAGWAHSILFAAELPDFRKFLPTTLQSEMIDFNTQRRENKKRKKDEKTALSKSQSVEVAIAITSDVVTISSNDIDTKNHIDLNDISTTVKVESISPMNKNTEKRIPKKKKL